MLPSSEGPRLRLPPAPPSSSHEVFRGRKLKGVEIHRPGHVFYLFNCVAQQNLIVNKKEMLYTFQTPCFFVVL